MGLSIPVFPRPTGLAYSLSGGTEWLVPKSPVAFHSLGLLPVCIPYARSCEPYRYRYHLTCCVLMMILLLPRLLRYAPSLQCRLQSPECALGVRDAYLISAGLVGLDPLIHAGTVGLHYVGAVSNKVAMPHLPTVLALISPQPTRLLLLLSLGLALNQLGSPPQRQLQSPRA